MTLLEKTLVQYIAWMQEMITKLELYTKDIYDFDAFQSNPEKVDACLVPLIQIGEIAMHMQRLYPDALELPYKDIIGFRVILVHMYHKIDTKVIRNIIKNHIPKLKLLLQNT